MRFHLVTLFPEFFTTPLATGLLGRAGKKGEITVDFQNPRYYSTNRRRDVDDYPYGGGSGMVMSVRPVAEAVSAIPEKGRILLMSPAGRPLDNAFARELAKEQDITIICGRYEGIDERLSKMVGAEEVAIGDIVLNGGETAALAVIEGVSRFVEGFLGCRASAEDESFSNGLLEYPQYTRPEEYGDLKVPDILLSGHHRRIARWRRDRALEKTLRMRPALLEDAPLYEDDAPALAQAAGLRPARNLSFCLMHYPVMLEGHKIGSSSLTNLDVHDIARISRSYGMRAFYVLTPISDQLRLLHDILRHWQNSANRDRARALALVRPVATFEEMLADTAQCCGVAPECIASSARWPKKLPSLTPRDILEMCCAKPVIICLGTSRGLAPEAIRRCTGQLRPLRFLNENHLSVRSAAAIIADRILGDFN